MDEPAYLGLRYRSALWSPDSLCERRRRELSQLVQRGCDVLERYASEGTVVWGVFERGRLIGTAVVTPRPDDQAMSGKVVVWGLQVMPVRRGDEVALKLVRKIAHWCEWQPGVDVIVIESAEARAVASRVFPRYGFVSGPARDGATPASERHDNGLWVRNAALRPASTRAQAPRHAAVRDGDAYRHAVFRAYGAELPREEPQQQRAPSPARTLAR